MFQLLSWRLCLCLCLRICNCLCLCICVPNSFLNSYYHKLSENVWVWGSGATRSEIYSDVTIAGRQQRKDRATQPMDHWRLRWAIKVLCNNNNSIKWCYSFFISSFILVSHAVIVSVVRRYLLSDNVLEANMKFSFYLFTLRGECKFHHIEEENITLMSFWSISMLS